jgi:hypothetical protein
VELVVVIQRLAVVDLVHVHVPRHVRVARIRRRLGNQRLFNSYNTDQRVPEILEDPFDKTCFVPDSDSCFFLHITQNLWNLWHIVLIQNAFKIQFCNKMTFVLDAWITQIVLYLHIRSPSLNSITRQLSQSKVIPV